MWPQPSAWLQDAEASVVQPPVDEAKAQAVGKRQRPQSGLRKSTGHLPWRRHGNRGDGGEARLAHQEGLLTRHRAHCAGDSVSVVTMPHRKDFASDTEHQVKFNLWLKTGGFKGKVLNGAVREPEHLARAHACVDPCRSGSSRWPRSTRSRVLTMNAWVQKQGYPPFCKVVTQVPGGRLGQAGAHC